jgi:hypothetical protein
MVFSRRMNDIRICTQVLRYLDAETDVDAHRHQAVSNFGRGESSSSTSTTVSREFPVGAKGLDILSVVSLIGPVGCHVWSATFS